MKRYLDEARKIIRMASVSTEGNEEVVNYLSVLFQDRGLKTTLQQVTHSLDGVSKRQFNLVGVLGDPLVDKKIRKGLLLLSPLDTAAPGNAEGWTQTGGNPYAAVVQDERIYGLGVASGKLDLLCRLYAAEKMRERKLQMPLYLVGTCGSQMGMLGTRYLIKSLSLNPKMVLVGAPTQLKLATAQKAQAEYRISLEYQQVEKDARGFNRRLDLHSFGKISHGGPGLNALLGCLDLLQKTADQGFEFRLTRLKGGQFAQQVPDHTTAQLYLASHQFEDFKRFFRDWIRGPQEKLFRVELGGTGEAGVRFLPDALFKCVQEVRKFFDDLGQEFARGSAAEQGGPEVAQSGGPEAHNGRDERFTPPVSTVHLGAIRQRAMALDLVFDLRFLPKVDPKSIDEQIQKGIRALASRYPGLNILASRDQFQPALEGAEGDTHQEWVKSCKSAMQIADLKPDEMHLSAATEASLFALAGYPSLAWGPGELVGNVHSANEHCLLQDLERAATFYERLIEKVCL